MRKRDKVKTHIRANKVKYTITGSMVVLGATLELIGQLGPVLCGLPMVHDSQACINAVNQAGRLGLELSKLDSPDGGLE